MSFDEAISRLIGDIYASPIDEVAWKRVLDQLLQRTGSHFLFVSAVDLRSQKYSKTMWYGADNSRFLDGVREYEAEMFSADPLLNFATRYPKAGFAESRKALHALGRTPDDDDYLRFVAGQLGSGHNAVCYSLPKDDLTLGLSINLPASRSSFEDEQIRLFRLLFDHLERATWLAARPPDMDSTKDAVLLLNERGIVVSMSPGAESLVAYGDGLHLSGRRLHGTRPADTQKIEALIARTVHVDSVGGGGGALAIERPSGKPAWLLTADYLPTNHTILNKFMATIMVKVIERPLRNKSGISGRLVQLFSLTPTETRLLEVVYGANMDLREAANRLELTYSTARVHMRRILGKMDVRSQAELMRLLTRLES